MERRAEVSRRTRETDIRVSLDIDGRGVARVKTGIRFLDHLLTSLAVHGRFDLEVEATSLDQCAHHLVEDVAIVLGRALKSALGDKRGIRRFGYALVPMDEALVLVAVDLSGRGYAEVEVEFDRDVIDGMDARLIRHLLGSMALNAG
ncbi:TPA: imidazoleglycerol-phosphate dehydratase, partial [Candidatus Bathyarchaeota archaeon]|nr:imidazoleglycerol-phosphate dehydratase [Candidatus Bathyarchaeota archaeon]